MTRGEAWTAALEDWNANGRPVAETEIKRLIARYPAATARAIARCPKVERVSDMAPASRRRS